MKKKIMMLAVLYACLFAFGTGFSTEPASVIVDEGEWFDHFYPYRIEINLAGASEGKAIIDVAPQQLIDSLEDISPDIVNLHSFAFEKAVLVDPGSMKVVGGFKLVPESGNLVQHGDFDPAVGMSESPWEGFVPEEMKVEKVSVGDKSFNAL